MIPNGWKETLPTVEGKIRMDAPLAGTTWFKVGGKADVLFKPKDENDLASFLSQLPAEVPVMVLGASSNTIVRDGGIEGVVIKLGRGFSDIQIDDETVTAGACALDLNVAHACLDASITGLEFLSGIPGTVGGGLRMNAGAYGGEFKDVLIEAHGINRNGEKIILSNKEMGFSYRHSQAPKDIIFTHAIFKGQKTDTPETIKEQMDEIKSKRESTQPIKEKTGGSTFANPTQEECDKAGIPLMKSWQLIEQSGGHEIQIGDAQMSSQHKNFMINKGNATAEDLETLGETIRKKVLDQFGISLRWEIRRIGRKGVSEKNHGS